MIHHINLFLELLTLILWVGLFVIYYRDRLFPWLINRFTFRLTSKKNDIKNGRFPDGTPLPFRTPPPEESDTTE